MPYFESKVYYNIHFNTADKIENFCINFLSFYFLSNAYYAKNLIVNHYFKARVQCFCK